MRTHLGHPSFPQYGFYNLTLLPDVRRDLELLGPVSLISGTYDWPNRWGEFRNWTDEPHSLWWPDEAEAFASAVFVIDDARNDLLVRSVEAQMATVESGTWRWPYLILSARLSPAEGQREDGTFEYPAESYEPTGVGPVAVETPLVEFKLYPLQAVNLTSVTGNEQFRGLWLLPLVDVRYFMRNVPLNQFPGRSSSSGSTVGYPFITIGEESTPDWMPPVLGYPRDLAAPANYVPISNQGTATSINGSSRFGEATDTQAELDNVRIVCRDVRSNYNSPNGTSHNNFTGVIADYPEAWPVSDPLTWTPATSGVYSYHVDAMRIGQVARQRISGGICDLRIQNDLTAKKLQFIFHVANTETFYCITLRATVDYPTATTHFVEDTDGPDDVEKTLIPSVLLGVGVSDRYPLAGERAELVTAAKRWALLYFAWRHRQCFMRLPGIHPFIPNGHAKMIRWDFAGDEFYTTYIAIEGIQGTDLTHAARREPFMAQIDGEGNVSSGLHGFYAYTQLRDHDGQLTNDHPNPKRGYVAGVNGRTLTYNPARDESGKVAVPVGLIVRMFPGVPYLDVATGKIWDHCIFNTTDLTQIVRLKPGNERNQYGHLGAIIMRWNPVTKSLEDSKDIWAVVLR